MNAQIACNAQTLLPFFKDFVRGPREFIIFDDDYRRRNYSYQQVADAANAFARRLTEQGIKPDDKVIIWSENRPEWLAAFWACVIRKVVVVPVDYHSTPTIVHSVQEIVQPCVILVGDEVNRESLDTKVPVWSLTEMKLWERSGQPSADVSISPDDTAEIVFTSGSTAAPKGVIITHRNISADLAPICEEVAKHRLLARMLSPLRFLVLLPLSHMFGQAMAMFFPPLLQGTTFFMLNYATPEVVRQIHGRKVSFLVAVPKMLDSMRRYVIRRYPELEGDKLDVSHWLVRRWRYRKVHRLFGRRFFGFVVGGAPLGEELERFWRKLGFLIVQGYGLTETAPVVSFNHPLHLKPGTVGRPLPGVGIKIEPDGEILVKGAVVTPGYYHAPPEASSSFENGWFRTGDIGQFDEDGYLVVRGRKKDMIVTPEGLKVFPDDVELVLSETPGVRDSAVVGKDRVHAVLVLEPNTNPEAVVRRANESLEAQQKIQSFSVWNSGELPRTEGTGKLKRAIIQKWVDAGAPPAAAENHDELTELVQRYAPDRRVTLDSSLDQLGLSSLDKVELMVELEERFNLEIDESKFTRGTRVAEIAEQILHPTAPAERLSLPDWNHTRFAGLIRRLMVPATVLPLTRICARIKVTGAEILRSLEGPVIFAANHQSHLDAPVIFTTLSRRWRYRIATAMWREFFDAYYNPQNYPLHSRLASTFHFYAASLLFNGFTLSQQEVALRETMRHIGDLVSDGWSVLIFPEGTRSPTGAIDTFHPGVGMIASRLDLPVVPIRLIGVNCVLPPGGKMVHPGPVEIHFGAPMELHGNNFLALAHSVEERVRAL